MPKLAPRMFIAQSTLEAWMDSENVDVGVDAVVFKRPPRTYQLEPAVLFLSAVPEDAGVDMVGKVLSEARIASLGGELMGDSVVFGDVAFTVETGFIGALVPEGSIAP